MLGMKTLESVNVTGTAHCNQLVAWNNPWVEYEIVDALSVEERVVTSTGFALLVYVVEGDCYLVATCFSLLCYPR